jgi:hypothetical protein
LSRFHDVAAALDCVSICASTLFKNEVSILRTSVSAAEALGEFFGRHKPKVATEQEMVIKLAGRTQCDSHKPRQLGAGAPPAAFR